MVRVRGAREHNLQNIDVDIPRDALVVFTGVSGSGKSSLAFGTIYAEAQRRYLESVAPYARRLFHQLGTPQVDDIAGLPPAVALQQQRGSPTTRSSVGSVTTLSNLLRMLFSRAGDYPKGAPLLYAESFSPNTPEGACPTCHGLGRVYDVTEKSLVPDDSKTIRERAVAAWPPAWHGQNLRDILTTLGHDVDVPWRDLPKKTRDWILYTEEQPTVPVYAGFTLAEVKHALKHKQEPSYMGTFTGARKYVLETFAKTESASMKKRVSQYLASAPCPTCKGQRLRKEALAVRFAGHNIAELSHLPLAGLAALIEPYAARGRDAETKGRPIAARPSPTSSLRSSVSPSLSQTAVTQRITLDMHERLEVILDLGLGYLTLDRSTPTLSPGELQRLRLATQVRSNLFGVVYVLDEPSAGLHPADTQALLRALDRLKTAGNSIFVVEHELDVICHADWIVDVGPHAGQHGGRILYSGPPDGLRSVKDSLTRPFLFATHKPEPPTPRTPHAWLKLTGVTRNNLHNVSADFPLGVLTAVTGVSGSGKSSLVTQALVELVSKHLGHHPHLADDDAEPDLESSPLDPTQGRIESGAEHLRRLVLVDQKPIGRTPRSNLATYTGLFDRVRELFAQTPEAKKRRYNAGRFSFNVPAGRCEHCKGEGFVMVELLFLPSVYTPCPTCEGRRYNAKTLDIRLRDKTIADVLALTVDDAAAFFEGDPPLHHALSVLREVGLGYLRLGQPATELSGGEAQRIKLATELQSGGGGSTTDVKPARSKSKTLYILDEPTTGLHPADVERLLTQLQRLVTLGHTVVAVEHDMRVIAASDFVIDIGPGAGSDGGRIVTAGPPASIPNHPHSLTAKHLKQYLSRHNHPLSPNNPRRAAG
jgi:excinuclease ABC subunit A